MITPIIMESDIEVVREKVELLHKQQQTKVHFDIGDGLFCDLLTIAPADLQAVDLGQLKLDFHLLVDDPVEWIEECVALSPARVIGQIEHMGEQGVFVDAVGGYGVEAVEPGVLKRVKTILLLEIPPGTTGSPFDMRVLEKINKLKKIFHGNIVVDGGINPQTYKLVMEAGATEVGSNSSYWKGEFGYGEK